MTPLACLGCAGLNFRVVETEAGHIEARCAACNRHLRYLPQEQTGGPEKLMPFGKYQGVRIGAIPIDYLRWGVQGLPQRWRRVFQDELARREANRA